MAAAWWLRHNLSTGDSDRPLFRAESMISLQRILSGRARAWDNGNIFSIPRRIVASDPLRQLSSSERVFFPPLFLMWSSPPPRSPFHLSEHHEFSDLEGVRVTIGVKLAGKVDRGWLGRRGGGQVSVCARGARGDRCHDASGDRLPPSHSYLPASTRLKCADD